MPRRVSHILLDPFLVPLVPKLYQLLPIPRRFPPERIILVGHLLAIGAAFGFAFSTQRWWCGLIVAAGVAGNHVADMIDGTHARTTNQCRNGGELLDHFTDPLSFSYWSIGLGVSIGNLPMGLAGVLILYATAVLTSIKAKLLGEFTLARFGPTEMKVLFALYGLVMAATMKWSGQETAIVLGTYFFWIMLIAGVVQLLVNLVQSVRRVNAVGAPPDTTAWELTGQSDADKM